MKKLSSFVLAVILFVSTFLYITPPVFAAITGDAVSNDKLLGEFSVPANLETGIPFTNKTNKEVLVTVSTEGTWDVSSQLKNFDANGAPSSYLPYLADSLKYLKYPDKKPFSLLAVNQSNNPPTVVQVGEQIKFNLAPGATISFLNNDIDTKYVSDSYSDNTGSLTVKWSATPTSIDLAGTWIGEGYSCGRTGLIEKVQISNNGNSIFAKKIEGDDCVPAGNVTFEGTLPNSLSKGSSFPVTFTAGTPLAPASAQTPQTLTIIDDNSFTVARIKFTRVQ